MAHSQLMGSRATRMPGRDAAEGDVFYPLSVKGVCLQGDHVLLARNARAQWELPGGRPNPRESFEDCVVREFLEETGLHVTCVGLLAAYPFEVSAGAWVNIVVYRCELTDTSERMRASHEHSYIRFVQPREIPDRELPAGYLRAIDWRRLRHGVPATADSRQVLGTADRSPADGAYPGRQLAP